MRRFLLILLMLAGAFATLTAQTFVHPTHWWSGMKNPELQILIHDTGAGRARCGLRNAKGVKLSRRVSLPIIF